jgi:hypothetical protein
MRDRAAHERGVEEAGQLDVVDEAPGAAQQPRILQARNRSAH